jgi:UDP-glucuronate decarboxylase
MKLFFLLFLSISAIGQGSEKKVLVTGGAGFLGSHLCDKLIDQGCSVICVDNLQTGSLQNIEHLMNNPRFTFVLKDVCTPFDSELVVDEIYNMACPASPIHYQNSPVSTIKTCVLGAINVLELACRCHAKVFQASTSEVYGDPLVHPQTETYWGNVNPIGLRSCYDEGKRCAETLFFDYHREFGARIKVARIFNTYGPRMSLNDGRVVSNFIVQALKGIPITIYGKGEQTRSFCYVSDLIEGIVALMDTNEKVTGPVNLGNPCEFTMLELVEKIKNRICSESPIIFMPLPEDDPKMRNPDITLAQKILQWNPEVSLDNGLQRTIEYFQNKLVFITE